MSPNISQPSAVLKWTSLAPAGEPTSEFASLEEPLQPGSANARTAPASPSSALRRDVPARPAVSARPGGRPRSDPAGDAPRTARPAERDAHTSDLRAIILSPRAYAL